MKQVSNDSGANTALGNYNPDGNEMTYTSSCARNGIGAITRGGAGVIRSAQLNAGGTAVWTSQFTVTGVSSDGFSYNVAVSNSVDIWEYNAYA